MYERVDQLQALYDQGLESVCPPSADICTDDCVYPGDADKDGKVTLKDYLNTALGQQSSGPEREGPFSFLPLPAEDWDESTMDNVNYKHLDGNGDGTIDFIDFTIHFRNYGMMAPWYEPVDDISSGLEFTIMPESTEITVEENFFDLDVLFDPIDVDSLYGLTFTIEYDTSIFQSALFNNASPLFEIDSTVLFERLSSNERFEYMITGFDLRNRAVSEMEVLSTALLVRNDLELPAGVDTATFTLRDVKAVMADGTILEMGGNKVEVLVTDGTVSTSEPDANPIQIIPNPSNGQVYIDAPEKYMGERYSVYRADGALLERGVLSSTRTRLDLPAGLNMVVFDSGELQPLKALVDRLSELDHPFRDSDYWIPSLLVLPRRGN